MTLGEAEQSAQNCIRISGVRAIDGTLHWNALNTLNRSFKEPVLMISFRSHNIGSSPPAGRRLFVTNWKSALENKDIKFLYFEKGSWYINTTQLKNEFPNLKLYPWLTDLIIKVQEDYEITESDYFGNKARHDHLSFVVTEEDAKKSMPKKIFLSHKSADKPLVKEYYETLKALGLDPWLDEEDMAAGVILERALQQGVKSGCAIVFFITSKYIDSGYLAAEIDYAIQVKRKRGDDFSIIGLVIQKNKKEIIKVPEPLEPYIYKPIMYGQQLKGLREILKALPFEAKVSV